VIRAAVWQAGVAPTVEPGQLPPPPGEGQFVWIDLVAPTADEDARVFQAYFPVHPLTLEDINRPRRLPEQGAHLPKVEEFPGYLFVIVNPLPVPGDNGKTRYSTRTRPQLSAILTRNLLITHHDKPLPCIDAVWDYCARHDGCLGRGPDYLFHLVLDAMVDEYAPVVETLADRLDRIEGRIFTKPTRDLLARLLRLKRHVSFLRKTIILEREVLARLTRGEFALVEAREMVYYRNVYDHLVRYAELVESGREMVSDLMQTHLAATSNRLNEVMKLLTMFSAIVLPMSLIAGVYGMNFENLPEVKWPYGYYFALGLMAITGLVGLVYFRWKKWI
jgi:magnesium transporter